MKKIILVPMLVCATFGFFEATAQQKPKAGAKKEAAVKREMDPHERAKQSAERAQKRYTLSDEQKSQWEAAAMQRAMENQQLKEQMKMAQLPEEKKMIREQAKQNKMMFENNVSMFLDKDQKVKFNRDLQEREQKKKAAMKSKKKPATPPEDDVFSED